MHTKNFLSATALSKKTAATLDLLEKGDAEKLIILKNLIQIFLFSRVHSVSHR